MASGANVLPAGKHLLTALNQVAGAELHRGRQTWEEILCLDLITVMPTQELVLNASLYFPKRRSSFEWHKFCRMMWVVMPACRKG